MGEMSMDELRGWFAGRIPDDWFIAPIEVTVDREYLHFVDTHVARLSRRLGLTRAEDPVRIERDLVPLFPRDAWALLAHLLIFHGRRICRAPRPRCADCALADICPSAEL